MNIIFTVKDEVETDAVLLTLARARGAEPDASSHQYRSTIGKGPHAFAWSPFSMVEATGVSVFFDFTFRRYLFLDATR